MNRDATVVQVAIFLIVIAIIGVAILKQQNKNPAGITTETQQHITPVLEGEEGETPPLPQRQDTNSVSGDTTNEDTGSKTHIETHLPPAENINSSYTKLIKQYFAAIATKDYLSACDLIA